MKPLIAAVFTLNAAAAGATCPEPADISGPSAVLLAELQAATSEGAARLPTADLWALWLAAPDAEAQDMLDRGLAALRISNYAAAEATFDELIAYCPAYAEGYNQRAFAAYLQGDYGHALEDLDRALERSPTHVAAMSGKALTLMGLGRIKAAQGVLREALALNPWLPERRFLIQTPGEPL